MPQVDASVVELDLASVDDFLSPPPARVLGRREVELLGQSGLELLQQKLTGRPMRGPCPTVVLRLPAGEVSPALRQQVREGFVRFCDLRLAALRADRADLRHRGWRAVWVGLAVLAVCLGFSTLFGSGVVPFVGGLLANVLTEGFIIAGWVLFWRPIEMLVLNPMAISAKIRRFQWLRTLEMDIRPGSA